MIAITKSQRDYLEKKGCTFGDELHKTHSRYKHYYAIESKKVKSLLMQYEDEIRSQN